MNVSDAGVRLPSTGKPEFIMTGIQRPDGTVRLYASRDLKSLNWGQRDLDYPHSGVAWDIDTDMQHMLIIDKPTWGEAFARAFEIWANEDRNKAIEQAQARTRELEDGLFHFGLDDSRHKGTQQGCALCTAQRQAKAVNEITEARRELMRGGIED